MAAETARARRAGRGSGRTGTSGVWFAGPANGIEGVPLLQALLALRAHLRSRRVLKMSRTEVKLRIRINWSSAKSARPSIWTPTPWDERDLHIQAPRCSGRRNDRIPKLLPHADEACNSDQLDPCKLGSRFEPARLRRPRLTPRSAPRPSRKTTQYEPNGRAGGRGGAPPPGWLRGMATAALPKFPARSMAPCRARTLSWPEPEYPKPSRE